MYQGVYRVLGLLCGLLDGVPVGTNLGLLHLLWMLVSGRLLETRGAVIPGLSLLGLEAAAVRRAWAALGSGHWSSAALLPRWVALVEAEGRWAAHEQAGYRPVAADVTGFWRPRLRGCRTSHYDSRAGKALPAIPVGIVARVGSVAGQRMGLPVALVRAVADDPRPATQLLALAQAAVAALQETDVLVVDGEFEVRLLQQAGATAYVARAAKNSTARRATLPPYRGRGARPKRGPVVRPLARTYRGRPIPATPPDRVDTWQEGPRDAVTIRAESWDDLLLPTARPGAPTFRFIAIWDPRRDDPLLLATSLPIPARAVRDLYLDRWPIEQLPLAAKQMLGAARQFVSAPETCQRLPELALLAGSLLTYAAATGPAIPTGFWDRRPRPTVGRLRRLLARTPFPETCPLPARIRLKASPTAHLLTGSWGQQHPRLPDRPPASDPAHPHPVSTAA
jgi:hypothetical protein